MAKKKPTKKVVKKTSAKGAAKKLSTKKTSVKKKNVKKALKNAGPAIKTNASSKRGKAPKTVERDAEQDKTIESLRHFIRTEGLKYLEDPNITSLGIGHKITKGVRSSQLCLQFTVNSKSEEEGTLPEGVSTSRIPSSLTIGSLTIPTDVLERSFKTSYQLMEAESTVEGVDVRKTRQDPMMPGISVSHQSGSAGTIGMIVYDQQTGVPCILSNWHVLHTASGKIGDKIVQPGPHDDNRTNMNGVGILLRSHLGAAGDCALAQIDGRNFNQSIHELGVTPTRLAKVDLGDRVIKSGRTTGVTHGIVRRVDVMANISYDGVGNVPIGGFEIEPLPGSPSSHEISQRGDSGSVWLIANSNGKPTDVLAGLHFAGESVRHPDEHALACYAHAVVKKLGISLVPLNQTESLGRIGYQANFLSEPVHLPSLSEAILDDSVKVDGSHLVHYMHFSVCQSQSRRLPRFVAWNIDGGQMKQVSRRGIKFVLDPRLPAKAQVGDELYKGNALDRGHVARRADLTWGSLSEAKRANKDSFFFTNITPQHEAFNQSTKGGLWGKLENAIFEDVDVENLRISVMAGPIFGDNDNVFRDVLIPRDFWKLIAFKDTQDSAFKIRAFILTQRDLVNDLEILELDPFRLFQVSLNKLGDETGLDFSELIPFDTALESIEAEVREVNSSEDLAW